MDSHQMLYPSTPELSELKNEKKISTDGKMIVESDFENKSMSITCACRYFGKHTDYDHAAKKVLACEAGALRPKGGN